MIEAWRDFLLIIFGEGVKTWDNSKLLIMFIAFVVCLLMLLGIGILEQSHFI